MNRNFLTKRFYLKSRLSMAFQTSVDSVGIRRLRFKCGWWHPGQSNDAVASEPEIWLASAAFAFPLHLQQPIHGTTCNQLPSWRISLNSA